MTTPSSWPSSFAGRTNLDHHFLVDSRVADQLCDAAALKPNETVLEIGPGAGVLTGRLAERVKQVVCIEIDPTFKAPLERLAKNLGNVDLIFRNVLNGPLPTFDKLVSNIPFSILEPLIQKFVVEHLRFGVILTGSRFATTIAALPRETKFSRLTLLVNCFFHAAIIDYIPRTAFSPQPGTDVAIVKLQEKAADSVLSDPVAFVFRMALERGRRKVKNALAEGLVRLGRQRGADIGRRTARTLVGQLNIDPRFVNVRIGQLPNREIRRIALALAKLEVLE